jgi:hypothetical protein
MSEFNNETYRILLTDVVGDAFYSNNSNRGKLQAIRSCAEVVVRRLFIVPEGQYLILSNYSKKIKAENSKFLKTAFDRICDLPNKASHTDVARAYTDEEVESAVESLFDMYAYLLVKYFIKYEFGRIQNEQSNRDILSLFSLLPPIIRYKVLNELYILDKCNAFVIWKLTLAIEKAYDLKKAGEWLVEKEDEFTKISTNELAQYFPILYPNMHYQCHMILADSEEQRKNDKAIIYNDFESALPSYKKQSILQSDTPETNEFNSILEFLYLGRKEKANIL